MNNYLYDANQVRYKLAKSSTGKPLNWLFLPGGPGADSNYFHSLVELLELPGNVWLIDLPGSGSNVNTSSNYDFETWFPAFLTLTKQFENPVIVGHSFGGMLPLLFPELEERLKGIAILNAAPCLWLEQAAAYARQFNLPDLSKEMAEFTANPNQTTFEAALHACMPYYFPEKTLEKGRTLLQSVPFQFKPAVWWQRKAVELNFSAKWVPQQVPTAVVGGRYDCICPFSLFKEDPRFKRDNIQLYFGENSGHMGWVESPEIYQKAFTELLTRL